MGLEGVTRVTANELEKYTSRQVYTTSTNRSYMSQHRYLI